MKEKQGQIWKNYRVCDKHHYQSISKEPKSIINKQRFLYHETQRKMFVIVDVYVLGYLWVAGIFFLIKKWEKEVYIIEPPYDIKEGLT